MSVPSKMYLPDTLSRNAIQKCYRIKTMVAAADIDIVHIEENSAVSLFGDFGDEIPFLHFRVRECEISRCVFEKNFSSEKILNLFYAVSDVANDFAGVRKRHKIMKVLTADRCPANMV